MLKTGLQQLCPHPPNPLTCIVLFIFARSGGISSDFDFADLTFLRETAGERETEKERGGRETEKEIKIV